MAFLPFTRPTIDEETIQGVVDVLRSGWITSGPKVKEFESALSQYFGGRPVRAFSSGTATLEVALRLCGIGPGDEVITTPMSWVATANVILNVGARPVFVDVDPLTRNIDLNLIEAAITPATRAIIPVDLAGLPVDRNRLYEIAAKHGLRVIEDAAQSMGASWKGKRIGAFGDLISFSFHANKNMTTSEGGCLVLNDEAQIALTEKLRLQGVVRFPDGNMDVDVAGGKANLTDIAARIGLGQLPHIDAFTERRRELARHYFACFDRTLGCQLPPENFNDSNWHMFQILLPLDKLSISRGEFIERMRQREIGVGVHYPAMHLFSLYRGLGFKEGDFPHAERVGRETVTLPLFPGMSLQDVERVCLAIKDIIESANK
ncbi:LPS biosynthesis-like protein [Sulfurimicrobium lacus]|uniref:LPS biosynthesis-like protein n=1 Tax=Sulfurimicrobium lacus TaxID=2715678 RepID=A0A6F8VEJ0_9PROT|nr:DegT/DnrJ/EryC1/StrS aminotransferase family protein [Sulfurimicrobium lacus]BCB27175.1 LPS biosynthesis-like protein [Sulfurimicrobium lacus]